MIPRVGDVMPEPTRIRSPHDWPILFVGEANPYGSDPRYALHCEPERSAGGRLCRRICGLRPSTYLSIRRANLCPRAWLTVEARGRAARLVADASAPWRTLVLLGSKVADAFAHALRGAVTGDLSAWSVAAHEPYPGLAFRLVCLPHPSGLNRAWNEAGAFARARAMLAEYAPGPPYGEIDGGNPQ